MNTSATTTSNTVSLTADAVASAIIAMQSEQRLLAPEIYRRLIDQFGADAMLDFAINHIGTLEGIANEAKKVVPLRPLSGTARMVCNTLLTLCPSEGIMLNQRNMFITKFAEHRGLGIDVYNIKHKSFNMSIAQSQNVTF